MNRDDSMERMAELMKIKPMLLIKFKSEANFLLNLVRNFQTLTAKEIAECEFLVKADEASEDFKDVEDLDARLRQFLLIWNLH